MLRADSVVYFYLLLSIMRCVTPEADSKRCLNEGKTRKEKENCSHSAWLRRADETLPRAGRIPSGSWICLRHSNEIHRNNKPCLLNGFTRSSKRLKKKLPDYRPGTNWCCKCKLEADKSFIDHVKYIPWKRKDSNKQKIEYFLSLTFHELFLLARCTS